MTPGQARARALWDTIPEPTAAISSTALDVIVSTSTVATIRCVAHTGDRQSCNKLLMRVYNPTSGDLEFFCARCHSRVRAEVRFGYET